MHTNMGHLMAHEGSQLIYASGKGRNTEGCKARCEQAWWINGDYR